MVGEPNVSDTLPIVLDDATSATVHHVLNEILEAELSGVVRYTHYSLMITGPNRIPLVAFMKAQANESLLHAQQVGEILTGLGGHPSLRITPIEESHRHSIYDILGESMAHERAALDLYRQLLQAVDGQSVFLEEFARSQISAEEQHQLELSKMIRDFAPGER
jgi:bacterioferritin